MNIFGARLSNLPLPKLRILLFLRRFGRRRLFSCSSSVCSFPKTVCISISPSSSSPETRRFGVVAAVKRTRTGISLLANGRAAKNGLTHRCALSFFPSFLHPPSFEAGKIGVALSLSLYSLPKLRCERPIHLAVCPMIVLCFTPSLPAKTSHPPALTSFHPFSFVVVLSQNSLLQRYMKYPEVGCEDAFFCLWAKYRNFFCSAVRNPFWNARTYFSFLFHLERGQSYRWRYRGGGVFSSPFRSIMRERERDGSTHDTSSSSPFLQ